MLEKGADDSNEAMTEAALNGYISIVELMLAQGANNYNEVLSKAAREGQ